jgi:hypothetical protein
MDHSSKVSYHGALSSAEYEYNQSCLACHTASHLHYTINELKHVEIRGKNDKPIHIVGHQVISRYYFLFHFQGYTIPTPYTYLYAGTV